MAMITSGFAKLLAPGLYSVINQGYQEVEDMLDLFYKVEGSERSFEEEQVITGLGLFVETAELGETTYDDRLLGDYKKYTHLKSTLGIAISEEMYDDDLYGEMKNYGRELGRSARETPLVAAFQLYNRAFNASYTGPDGKVFCATDHPLAGGGTRSNRPTVAADLSLTALAQAETDMLNWQDDRGKRIKLPPRVLLTGTALKRKAFELTKSEYNPEAVERAANYVRSMGLQSYACPYITSAKQWFLGTDKQNTYLRWWWRKKFGVRMWEDMDRGALRARGMYRSSSGWTTSLGWWGSPGL